MLQSEVKGVSVAWKGRGWFQTALSRNAGQQGAFGATTPQRDLLLKSGHKTSLVIDSQGVCPT